MSVPVDSQHREIFLFFTLVALLLALALYLLRLGMETDAALIWKIVALAVFALNGPGILDRFSLLSGPGLTGVRTLLALVLGLAIAQLGTLGVIVLSLAAIVALALNVRAAEWRRAGMLRLFALVGLAILSVTAIAADFAATKYTSALSDELALYGRADGDVLIHSALINSLRYFGVPSAGIDGIAWTKYHFGLHVIVALLADNTAMSAILTFSVVKLALIYPLTFCAALQCAVLLRPAAGREIGLALLMIVLAFLVFIPPIDTTYLASANSETAIFSGFVILAILPVFYVTLLDPDSSRARRMWTLLIAATLILPLSLFKVSAGYSWASAVFVWSLYAFGLRDKITWLAWALTAAGGLLSLYLFAQPGIATPFGTPYFVERARATGDYLLVLVLTLNIGSLLYLVLSILRLWRAGALSMRTLLADRDFCFIAITTVLANLPGLLLDIVSGNAGHFIIQQNLLALPFLIAQLANLAQEGFFTGKGRGAFRFAGIAVALAIVVFGLYGAGKKTVADARAFISQRALINTADTSYYGSRKKRDLKADAAKYVDENGPSSIFSRAIAAPPAAGLATALMAARSEFGNDLAVYASPNVSSFWGLTYDCDGKSLFTMAAAGLPMINGYPPCPPKFVDNGYPQIVGTTALDPVAICARARDLAISRVLVIGSLDDRSKDEILTCGAGMT